MLIKSKVLKVSSFLISSFVLVYIFYLIYQSYFIVKNQYLDIGDTRYINQVREDEYTKNLASFLTKSCALNKTCEVQTLLDFVTQIPYKINESVARNPKKVVEQNFGDCDDKSNLLISLLKAKNFEAYFVLVPKHIFVLVKLDEDLNKKALYINNERFYILESTAKDSKIGFDLKYKLEEIEAIINPFINKKLKIKTLEYK